MALLPHGDGKDGNFYPQPNEYTQGINSVNAGLQTYASTQGQVTYVDCAKELFPDGKVSNIA